MSIFYLLSLALLAFLIWYLLRYNIIVHSNWFQPFDKLQFSSKEFYEAVEKSLRERELPNISFSRMAVVDKLRTVVFDDRREYLCVTRQEYRFQVCAAPFGNGFFVSYWFLEREQGWVGIVKKIPIIRFLLEFKTFYQLDTESMYRSFVHMCVLEAIDNMTTDKGVRGLTDYERRLPKDKR